MPRLWNSTIAGNPANWWRIGLMALLFLLIARFLAGAIVKLANDGDNANATQ